MKNIIHAKFSQNSHLRDLLFATGTKALIEATTDSYWGAAALLGSKLLKNGKWTGLNVLGEVMGEVREELRREYQWVQQRDDSSDEQSISASESSNNGDIDNVDPTLPPTSTQQSPIPPVDGAEEVNRAVKSPAPSQARPSEIGAVALNQSVTTRRSKNKNRKRNKGRGGVAPHTEEVPLTDAPHPRNQAYVSQPGAGVSTLGNNRSLSDQRSPGNPAPIYPTPPLHTVPSTGSQPSSANSQWFWPPAPMLYPPTGPYSAQGMCWPPTWNNSWNNPFSLPPPTAPPPNGSSGNFTSISSEFTVSSADRKPAPTSTPPIGKSVQGNAVGNLAGRKSLSGGVNANVSQGHGRKVTRKNNPQRPNVSANTMPDHTICIGSQTM